MYYCKCHRPHGDFGGFIKGWRSAPNLDIQKQCRKTQRATDEFTGTKNPDAFNLCVKTEQSAREKLAERFWATPSALDKTTCIHPADWSPSYFEWLGCLDTREYMRTQRKDRPEIYGRLEAVPKGELAIRWLNHQCRRMPRAIETHSPTAWRISMRAPRLLVFGAIAFIASVPASHAGPCTDDMQNAGPHRRQAASEGSCRADWSPSWRQYARSTDTAINRCCRGKTWRGFG